MRVFKSWILARCGFSVYISWTWKSQTVPNTFAEVRHIKVPQFHQSATIAQVTRVLDELYIDRMVPGTTFKFRAQIQNISLWTVGGGTEKMSMVLIEHFVLMMI